MSTTVWQINEADFPVAGSLKDKVNFWLRYAVLAPSAHNTQPWRVELQENTLSVYREPEHTLIVGDPTLRETTLGIGAFIENFCQAAGHWGYKVTVVNEGRSAEELLQAKLVIDSDPGEVGGPLFSGILQRHANRGAYAPDLLPAELQAELSALTEDNLRVFVITEESKRQQIAELVRKGAVIALSMRAMRSELAELVSHERDNKSTGMTVEAMFESPHSSAEADASTWLRDQLQPQQEAEHDQKTFANSPAHIVIGTSDDGPAAWLRAGRVLEQVLLIAAQYGLNYAMSAAPVEIPVLAPQLRAVTGEATYRPQALIRLGSPLNPEFTRLSARRTLVV